MFMCRVAAHALLRTDGEIEPKASTTASAKRRIVDVSRARVRQARLVERTVFSMASNSAASASGS